MVKLNLGDAEMSYRASPHARGAGEASLAVDTLSQWLLEVLGLHRLELGHSKLDPASCRVATNAGFSPDGILRSALLHSDGWHEMHGRARIKRDRARLPPRHP